LAALSRDSQKVLFYDFKQQKWSEPITENGNINFPTWSRGSKYLYFDEQGAEPTFRRVMVGALHSELLFSLKGVPPYLNTMVGGWSGLTPDGYPLFARDISTHEIYALELKGP
jgi:hypothetical protein